RDRDRVGPGAADRDARASARVGVSGELDAIFGALADPTRRRIVETLTHAETVSVPELTGELAISRQAIAKHINALDQAGVIQRAGQTGREVHYQLAPKALAPATDWLAKADRAWQGRLARLKRRVESQP
ncbi:MAG: helix-turn-helix transcriptional regulator, partial [Solirubrobacterales bacterium]|nr:helix-turn-helix transcriptional regulator [Solirubrobacterales bacterium]